MTLTRAAVVLPWDRGGRDGARTQDAHRSAEHRLAEAIGLTSSIGLIVVHNAIVPLRERRPATLLGEGQVSAQARAMAEHNVTVAIIDAALSPVQQRNLERAWGCKVIDRTGLILDIFGERAATKEGALQVELAHLDYQRSRLVRSWTHLERQRGGFGFLGGPGETQIETDRRLIGERIVRIERELEAVKRRRALQRASRSDVPYPIVALVGYTNAGKSTLFNRLTRAEVTAADMLFATLDPTMRLIKLPHGGSAILSDTVGFISDLPTTLISAFRATLEEVRAADVIVHVRDISHADSEAQARDVEAVLGEIGVANLTDRMVEAWNKVDLLDADARAALSLEQETRNTAPIAISAATGEGIDHLLSTIEDRLARGRSHLELTLEASDGQGLHWLYEHAEVMNRRDEDGGLHLTVRVPPDQIERLKRRFPVGRPPSPIPPADA